MCGRFALGIPKKRLEELYDVPFPDTVTSRYNIAPGQEVLVVGDGRARSVCWGCASPAGGSGLVINARSETVGEKPMFRMGVERGRCLVPVQAFYEWKRAGGKRQPFAFGMRDGAPFAMAGVVVKDVRGDNSDRCVVLTCPPNKVMRPVHDRMPVILPQEAWATWLNSKPLMQNVLDAMLRPLAENRMRAWPVSSRVNAVRNDDPHLLDEVRIMRQGTLL